MALVKDVKDLLKKSPEVNAIMRLAPFDDFGQLSGALFTSLCNNAAIGKAVEEAYNLDTALIELSIYDITETARRNFEPGGPAASLLFSRGVQAVMAHRVAHKHWAAGNTDLALALKATCGRTFDTDIHPAAQIGAGLWLDHGLGFVAGETCVIEEEVSIWHNVTLGSTLSDSSAKRHPHIGRGVVIGAGAIVLGNIKIGANANIGAGAIVVGDIAEDTLVTGSKATARGTAKISFSKPGQSQ